MQAWSPGNKCSWPQCASRAVFMTKGSFNRHVTNVHEKPLLCSIPNCSQKTPFGRTSDLRRHLQSAHSTERLFICPITSCDARIKEFARKDHLTKHMRERHDSYFCPMNHCFHSTKCSFAKPENLAEHIENAHGPYECVIKACARAPSSKFHLDSLFKHLVNHHGESEWYARLVLEGLCKFQEQIITDAQRPYLGECRVCERRLNTAD